MDDHRFRKPRCTTRRGWIASLISLALVVSLFVALPVFSALAGDPASPTPPPIFYLKDGQMYYRNFAQAEPVQVTRQLFANGDPGAFPSPRPDDGGTWTAEAIAAEPQWYEYFLFNQQEHKFSDTFRLSNDGRRALYLDNYDGYQGDLYLRDLTKPEAEPRLIANRVRSFATDATLTLLTFQTDESSEDLEYGLYRCNSYTGELTLILAGWNNYHVSDDGTQIVFLNSTGGWGYPERLYTYDDLTGLHYITNDVSDIGTAGGYEINEDFTQLRFESGGLYRYYAMDGAQLIEAQATGFPEPRWFLEYQVCTYTYSFRQGGALYCNGEELLPSNPDDFDTYDLYAACLYSDTLYLLYGAKMTPIAENVRDFELYEDGTILYQTKDTDFEGDLYYWCDGRTTLLLEDIRYFLHDAESLRGIIFD